MIKIDFENIDDETTYELFEVEGKECISTAKSMERSRYQRRSCTICNTCGCADSDTGDVTKTTTTVNCETKPTMQEPQKNRIKGEVNSMRKSKRFGAILLALVMLTVLIPALPVMAATEGNYEYTIADGKATITRYNGSESNVSVPSTLGGAPVTALGDYAFPRSDTPRNVTLPKSVVEIGNSSFLDCASITVAADNPALTAVDGVLYSKDMKTLVCYPERKQGASYVVPDSVTTLYMSALARIPSLESVTLPDGLTTIGDEAFEGCFMESITIPKNVTKIGDRVFSFSSLITVTVAAGNPAYTDVDGVLLTKNLKTLIYYPNAKKDAEFIVPDGVETICYGAIQNNNYLESVTLPDSLVIIDGWAFSNDKSLKSIVIPDGVTTLDDNAFYGCNSLSEITLPASVSYIGDRMFYGSNNLTITCYPNTYAHNYAKQEGYAVKLLEAPTVKTYTVTFVVDGQTVSTQTVAEGSGAIAPADPKKSGFTFTGWDKAFNNIKGDLTVTALWKSNSHTVTFKKGSGSGSWKSLSKKDGSKVTITKAVTQAFTRKGYVFAHFLGSDGKKYTAGATITIKSDLTLTAKYSKVSAPTKAVTSLKLTTPAAKQLKVTYKAVSGAAGYRIQYSTSKNFTKATTKTVHTTKLTYTLKSLTAKKTYYVRVTAYKVDSTKAKIYSKKTAAKSLKTK